MDGDGKTVSEGTSDGEGKITFTPITIEQGAEDKTHRYRIYEIRDEEMTGITFDDLEWELTVETKDHGTGELEMTYQLKQADTMPEPEPGP